MEEPQFMSCYPRPPPAEPQVRYPASSLCMASRPPQLACNQPLASALSAHFPFAKCVLVDLWGHGLTDTPLRAHDAALFHSLLESVMVHLEWDNAHLVGFSFGASATADFAAANPERVASMALVAPAGCIRQGEFEELHRNYLRGGEGIEEQAKEWILQLLEGGDLVVPADWKDRVDKGEVVAEAVRDWQMKNHEGHIASVVAIFGDGGVLDNGDEFRKAAKTGIKTLCILGELDDIVSGKDLLSVGMRKIMWSYHKLDMLLYEKRFQRSLS
ncbi:Alpha/Beta hydrolase protein [Trichoderma compactum]